MSERSLVYANCPTCDAEVPIITVDRRIQDGDVLVPEENDDFLVALYGRVPEPGEPAANIKLILRCPEGHRMEGAVPHAQPLE